MWLTLAPVKVNSDRVRPTRQPSAALSGSCADTEGGKCTECNCGSGQQAGSAMIWQFMVSAFITNVIFHHRRLAPHKARGWDVSSKGLEKKASVQCRIESEWHFVARSSALQKYKWPGLPGGTFLYPSDLSNTSGKDLVAFVRGRKNSGGDWVNTLSVTSKQTRQIGYDKIRLSCG